MQWFIKIKLILANNNLLISRRLATLENYYLRSLKHRLAFDLIDHQRMGLFLKFSQVMFILRFDKSFDRLYCPFTKNYLSCWSFSWTSIVLANFQYDLTFGSFKGISGILTVSALLGDRIFDSAKFSSLFWLLPNRRLKLILLNSSSLATLFNPESWSL